MFSNYEEIAVGVLHWLLCADIKRTDEFRRRNESEEKCRWPGQIKRELS